MLAEILNRQDYAYLAWFKPQARHLISLTHMLQLISFFRINIASSSGLEVPWVVYMFYAFYGTHLVHVAVMQPKITALNSFIRIQDHLFSVEHSNMGFFIRKEPNI